MTALRNYEYVRNRPAISAMESNNRSLDLERSFRDLAFASSDSPFASHYYYAINLKSNTDSLRNFLAPRASPEQVCLFCRRASDQKARVRNVEKASSDLLVRRPPSTLHRCFYRWGVPSRAYAHHGIESISKQERDHRNGSGIDIRGCTGVRAQCDEREDDGEYSNICCSPGSFCRDEPRYSFVKKRVWCLSIDQRHWGGGLLFNLLQLPVALLKRLLLVLTA